MSDDRDSASPPDAPPVVVQYLYLHAPGDSYDYPSSRAPGGSRELAERYLECVLVQAASLRLRPGALQPRQMLVTNLRDRAVLSARAARLLEQAEALGVELVFAEYEHRPPEESAMYASSRYVLDAILAATAEIDQNAQLWFTDVDCVWLDVERVLAAAPTAPAVGCVHIPYPPDWDVNGHTRLGLGAVVEALGGEREPVEWVGGELLCGSARELRALVAACERLEPRVSAAGFALATEEHLLSVLAAIGGVRFEDLCPVARRIWTGPRHGAPPVERPQDLGLWHLPSEKGLGFRRAARELLAGNSARLMGDLEDPKRAMVRFNIRGAGLRRRVRDDAWLSAQKLRARLPARRA